MNITEQAERLANTYADAILRLSYTYLKNTDDAQDICQTVFVKLLTQPRNLILPSMSGPMCFAWLPTPARTC